MTTISLRSAALSAVRLTGLAILAFATHGGTAEAKQMNACALRQSYCNERCIMRNDEPQITSCIRRTCDHQYKNCMKSGGGSARVRDHRGRR